LEHFVSLDAGEYSPITHASQEVAWVTLENVPATQAAQSRYPVDGDEVPGWQLPQAVFPSMLLAFPA